MRKILIAFATIIMALSVAGCERNDYQHPMYRSTNK